MAKKNNFSTTDAANIALGASSLVSGLSNRRPRAIRPTKMNSQIRPGSGDEAALNRTKERITQEGAAATRDVNRIAGSDVMSGFAARLGVQKNTTDAIAQAEATNSQLLKQDTQRADQQEQQQDYTNALLENQAQQTNFQADTQEFQQTRAAATAGVNSALNYNAQQEANIRNNEIVARQTQQQIDAIKASAYQDAYTRAIVAQKTPQEAAQIAEESVSRFGLSTGFTPARYK